jgi:SAM-dependent methyltransferase
MVRAESPFPSDAFSRIDEGEDAAFYATDRFVSHLDSTALATVTDLIERLVTDSEPTILDLMASWDSHIPKSLDHATVVGLGLNRHELESNEVLSERVVHDLNAEPFLPFADSRFDAVLCTVSVDYLTRPVEVFREVARVLKPGGLLLVTFSNRFFPPKVVKIWREASEEERVLLVRDFLARCDAFEEPRVFISKGKPRPADDRYAGSVPSSDPVYAVFADRRGGSGVTRELSKLGTAGRRVDSKVLRERERTVPSTLQCPHCEQPLSKWQVPQTPFIEWSSTHQFICFNDDCPHYVRGWDTFANQGIPGSYRFMYDPDSNGCHSVPVLTPIALRASIVPAEEPDDRPGIR